MSGSCENFVRPSLCYVLHLAMKLFRSDAEAKWIPANFVKRDQAVVTVEAGIFESFRQQGTGVLLESHCEMAHRTLIVLRPSIQSAGQKNLTNEVIHGRLHSLAFRFRAAHSLIDVGAIAGGDVLLSHIGPVHGETSHDFGKRIAQTLKREVAGVAVRKRDAA